MPNSVSPLRIKPVARPISSANSHGADTTTKASPTPTGYLSHIPVPPHVKIRCILAEAARNEINRRSVERFEQIALLKDASRRLKKALSCMGSHTNTPNSSYGGDVSTSIANVTQSVSTSSFSPTHACTYHDDTTILLPNCDDSRREDEEDRTFLFGGMDQTAVAVSADIALPPPMMEYSPTTMCASCPATHNDSAPTNTTLGITFVSGVTPPSMTPRIVSAEELSYHDAIAEADMLMEQQQWLMDAETEDVARCYAELMVECDDTSKRIISEGKRLDAVNIETELQKFASHVVMLHASIFPWRNGILLEPSIRCAPGHPLYDKGWLANGRGEGMLILSFAAAAQVTEARQAEPLERQRKVMEEANRQLNVFKKSQENVETLSV